ncbi:unnamed protein product [Aspergillus oryzae RIB40]|uniref:Probable 26S proteasome regulatory subunit p27 n=1 Tax=Aspergillus oryzae (strain ATCC 42149 / RIB 40) TaxID=510516 RepID=Q2ULD3_ASPOR|nr:unnamed protein product [Aspergillus oryzae RIB40]BAE57632.1 unnamed protein product [Aspergillus oryzae RIB40]
MVIHMDDNIHAPTVASGPTTTGGPDRDPAKLSMVELMQEKERIEEELSALSSILTSVSNQMAPTLENISNHLNLLQHGVNMNSSLTTFDDFPRADIDVAQSIHDHFANLQRAQGDTSSVSNTNGSSGTQSNLTGNPSSDAAMLGPPFARVNSVAAASPADRAGLKPGDKIRSFGTINWINHERLSKVAESVQQNEGRTLIVKVLRQDGGDATELDLELVPRRDWGGRGLLGCHLVPL